MAVVEIQQPSDTTFRLYDYERTDVGGRHRELQIDKALAAIKYDRQSPLKFDSTLLKCPAFTIEKICVDKYEVEHTNGRFAILTVVGGRGQISWQRGTVNVSMAETVLIPACMGPFSLQGSFEVLKTTAES
ncbi:MAG: hypothetical protein N3A57_08440 [Negativicutes bacterium]|nr:hypothetical protein [Negativicutes bacterium]